MNTQSETVDHEVARLAWRCRRGMRELDLLMSGYLRRCYHVACSADQSAFRSLLKLSDPELIALLLGRTHVCDVPTIRVLEQINNAA